MTSVDHGWHCVMIEEGDEVRVRSKDIELYDDEPSDPDAKPHEAQAVLIKAGKYQGQSGFIKSTQANGWYTIDVAGATISMRSPDIEIIGGKALAMVDVADTSSDTSVSPGTRVVLVGGQDDGKVGVVNKALNQIWYVIDLNGAEVRVRRSDFREVDENVTGSKNGDKDAPPEWVRIKAGKHKGQRGRVTNTSATWMTVEVDGETVKVRTSECEPEEDQNPPAGQSDEDVMEDGSRRKRPRGDDEDATEENDDDSTCEVGSTVRVRAGEHTGKVGQIIKTGHGWINIKIGDEDVRVRGKDIEPIKRCLLYTSPSPRDRTRSRMPSSA